MIKKWGIFVCQGAGGGLRGIISEAGGGKKATKGPKVQRFLRPDAESPLEMRCACARRVGRA